jgi:hypothetical protein
MSYIRSITPGVIRYTCGLYTHDNLANIETAKLTVLADLEKNNLTLTNLTSNVLLLDFLAEGHSPTNIQPLIDYLLTVMPVNNIRVLFNAVVDSSHLPYRAKSFVEHHACWDGRIPQGFAEKNVPLDIKFLCLSRRPNHSRAQFVSCLVEATNNARVSFGSGFPDWVSTFQPYFPKHTLPLTIDGIVKNQHDNHGNNIFKSSLFNIIVETSAQHESNNWSSIFITEKTFKCFDLYQLPIWFAVPGTVAEVRKLGFDLFDDIIDHSYDTIKNEAERITAIIDQVKILDSRYKLQECQTMRNRVWSRLEANVALLDNISNNYSKINDTLIADLIS